MKLKLRVTEKEIRDGTPDNCRRCPIALALLRDGYEDPHVEDEYVELWDEHGNLFSAHTTKISDFISAYDNGRPVDPFEVELYFNQISDPDDN